MLRHVRVVAFGQHLAAREHRDVVGQRGDDRKIVLDHEHRAIDRDSLDQRRDPLDVLVRHAGRRLVEQQHLGLERERGRDLERTLAPVGELAGVRVRELGQADRLEQRACLVVEPRERASRAPEVERMPALALQRDTHVLEHGEVREHRRDLERAHEPHPGDCRRPRPGDFAPVVEDLPACGREEMREQVEAGRLAGAVRSDERMDRPAADRERHVLDGDEALELLGEPLRLEYRVGSHSAPALPAPGLPIAVGRPLCESPAPMAMATSFAQYWMRAK